MSTVRNGQISLYCRFNKIKKGHGTSFQSPALNQKHIKNVFHTAHWYLTKFDFDISTLLFERQKTYASAS